MTSTPAMTGPELCEAWRQAGALVICRHEFKKTGLTHSAVFPPNMVSEAARRLFDAGYFLEDLSAMQVKEGFLVTYHYDSTRNPGRVAIRALAGDGVFTSVTSVYQGAEWHEREAADFFGLTFIGNSNPVPLLLAHDFPDPPPLRKAEADRASLAGLNLFSQAEVLDPAWAAVAAPPAPEKEEGAA